MVLSTSKVHDLGNVDRGHVSVLALLDVEHDALGARFVIETEPGAGLEVLPIGVVAELAVLRQAERVQPALDVQNDREVRPATDLLQ